MKVQVKIPEKISDIKLGQFQRYALIDNPTNVETLSIFLEQPVEVIKSMQKKDVDRIAANIVNLLESENDTPFEFKRIFKLNEIDFGFVPDLDGMSYGENENAEDYIQDITTMHKAMAVLFRPITARLRDKYTIEDYEGSRKYSEVMKDAPLDVVFGMQVFFYNLISDLLRAIPNYMEKQMNQVMSSQKKSKIHHSESKHLSSHSLKNGVNMSESEHLLRGILEDMKKSQN